MGSWAWRDPNYHNINTYLLQWWLLGKHCYIYLPNTNAYSSYLDWRTLYPLYPTGGKKDTNSPIPFIKPKLQAQIQTSLFPSSRPGKARAPVHPASPRLRININARPNLAGRRHWANTPNNNSSGALPQSLPPLPKPPYLNSCSYPLPKTTSTVPTYPRSSFYYLAIMDHQDLLHASSIHAAASNNSLTYLTLLCSHISAVYACMLL